MTDFLTKLNVVRHYGLNKAIPIIQFTNLRNRLDRDYQLALQTQQSSYNTLPGKLREVKILANGAHFLFEHARLELVFLSPDLARLTWEPGRLPIPYALAKTDWPITRITLSQVDIDQNNRGWQLASPELRSASRGFLANPLPALSATTCACVTSYYPIFTAWPGRSARMVIHSSARYSGLNLAHPSCGTSRMSLC